MRPKRNAGGNSSPTSLLWLALRGARQAASAASLIKLSPLLESSQLAQRHCPLSHFASLGSSYAAGSEGEVPCENLHSLPRIQRPAVKSRQVGGPVWVNLQLGRTQRPARKSRQISM
eukprot:TRINITY_DN1138_c0_g1_i2.p2 TRINITY_DN1138_c0_g1~~TRINITY_DN1138_c0_g1_i2.p2  ORF type:complete len:117 (-),score=6.66 TRINITY_DN1138_c0_g1_i2:439-789(-)